MAVVGAGPTGLTAANLLAQYGVECLVLERGDSIHPHPRAVHLDDEVHRILARLGLGDRFAAMSRPCPGLRLVDRTMRVVAEFRRNTAHGRHGYPGANMFDQPDLEEMLRADLARRDTATLRGGTEVTGLTQDGDGVRIDVADSTTGRRYPVRADHVLGCDGGHSFVRTSIGATMRDLRFTQRWLVVDVDTAADLGVWDGVHQVCDPVRAATFMRVGRTRYRWEFRLADGETTDEYRAPERLRTLLAPWTGDVPVAELTILRVAEYTFRARIADRWRDRRVFLLGDAAHLTPPFIGQGLGAGLRDAGNLAWKLAGVLGGSLPERVLATYETERAPHARTSIRLAKRVGSAMTGGGEAGNRLRRAAAPLVLSLPGVTERFLHGETPALHRSDLVKRPRLRRSLAGRLCPNADLGDGLRFDDLAAGRFAVVTSATPSAAQRAEIRRRGGVLVPAAPRTDLRRWLWEGRARAALVRPDGTVLHAGGDLSEVCAVQPEFGTNSG